MKNKLIEIFKVGKHTAADGSEIDFSAADVKAIADNYNPDVFEAPVVVGHPKANNPAFGWIKGLVYDAANKVLKAVPSQLNPDFVEAVNAGSYKKISASFYSPLSPNNPTPGNYSLRHVGFLGAQPPAIKGLESVSFAENEQTVEVEIDFSERDLAYNDKTVVRIFRNLKNFLIGKYSSEEADAVINEWDLESLGAGAQQVIADKNAENNKENNFSEPKDDVLTIERQKRTELEAKLAKIEADKTIAENADFCEKQIKNGRLLPAQKNKVLEFMNSLTPSELEFSEGEKSSQREFFKNFMETLPVQVNFAEVSAGTNDDVDFSDPQVLANKALEYQEQQAQKGNFINFSTAVSTVKG